MNLSEPDSTYHELFTPEVIKIGLSIKESFKAFNLDPEELVFMFSQILLKSDALVQENDQKELPKFSESSIKHTMNCSTTVIPCVLLSVLLSAIFGNFQSALGYLPIFCSILVVSFTAANMDGTIKAFIESFVSKTKRDSFEDKALTIKVRESMTKKELDMFVFPFQNHAIVVPDDVFESCLKRLEKGEKTYTGRKDGTNRRVFLQDSTSVVTCDGRRVFSAKQFYSENMTDWATSRNGERLSDVMNDDWEHLGWEYDKSGNPLAQTFKNKKTGKLKSIKMTAKDSQRAPKNVSCAEHSCDKNGAKFCKGCRTVRYCSRGCQKIHWPSHKKECKLFQKLRKARNPSDFSFPFRE